MKPIISRRDLDEVRSLPRAVVFLYVDWSVQARQSEAIVREFIAEWSARLPELPIEAYRADLSDQQGDVWEAVRKWLRDEPQRSEPLTYGGNGAFVWVQSGKVIKSVPYLAVLKLSDLMAITRNIFANPAVDVGH